MRPYRFSFAAAWTLVGIGWLLVVLAFLQLVAASVATPNPLLYAVGLSPTWSAVLIAGKVFVVGLSLAVLGGVARAVLEATVKLRA
ncbi:MAG: hypothetical protein JNN30_05440 [Rhodanobacteraceae bacterium]|nr:hypothetical protein [Rhodanobacteraceae bacterium]